MTFPLRRDWKPLLAATASGAAALLAYAHLIEPRWLSVERWAVRQPELPDAWEGMRVVQLSDLQFGMWGQDESVTRRAVARAASLRPDLVALTGDFVHKGRWTLPGNLFTPLTRIAPVYAVLGNHDHEATAADTAMIVAGLRAQGVRVLVNEHQALEWRGASRTLVGIDDFATEHADLVRAVTGITPGTRLLMLLTHVPDAAANPPPGWFPLILAGHTHGGQVRLPLLERNRWFRERIALLDSVFPRGWYKVASGLLYVNRGIGMSDLPLRFRSRPEVTLFVLSQGSALPPGADWARIP